MGEESLSNVRTVKAFAREEEEDERYGNEIDRYYQLAKQMGVSLAIFQGNYNNPLPLPLPLILSLS